MVNVCLFFGFFFYYNSYFKKQTSLRHAFFQQTYDSFFIRTYIDIDFHVRY